MIFDRARRGGRPGPVVGALVLAVGLALAQEAVPDAPRGIDLLEEVRGLARDHFFDPEMGGVDWTAVGERYANEAAASKARAEVKDLINRMLDELGASHTRLYTRDEPAYYQLLDIFKETFPEQEKERIRDWFPRGIAYDGIGVATRVIEGRRFVTGIVEGTPAHRSNLRVGDEILSVDGEPFRPIHSFAGKSGSPVALHVQRSPDPADSLTVNVTPEQLYPVQMFLEAISESLRIHSLGAARVGYVRIWSYAGARYQEALVDQIAAGRLEDADALVLDIRGGWGGANPEYLNLFNRNLPVLSWKSRGRGIVETDRQWRKPVVFLVDGGTRSGKELLAFGFKAYGIGPVVGTRTAGAVLGGKPFLLSDGSLLMVAVTDVFVDGVRLEGVGVEPDVVVPFDPRHAAGRDPQLERALAVAAAEGNPTP